MNDVLANALEDNASCCAWCRSINLHHDRITVFDGSEDDKETMVTEIENGAAMLMRLPSDQTRNPSSRRHSLTIRFYCEQCDGLTELTQGAPIRPANWTAVSNGRDRRGGLKRIGPPPTKGRPYETAVWLWQAGKDRDDRSSL
jgi:hypothetical protein